MGEAARSANLAYEEGSSNKVYNLTLWPERGTWKVVAEWGRRGSLLRVDTKYQGQDKAEAEKVYDALLKEKVGKGYRVSGTKGVASVPTAHREVLAVKGWLPTDCTPEEGAALLHDPAWLAQEKANGIHVIAYRLETVVGTNKIGQVLELPPVVKDVLCRMPKGSIVAGELHHAGPFDVFDLLEHKGMDLRSQHTTARYKALVALGKCFTNPVRVIRSAESDADKVALLAALEAERAEGIIFKLKTAPYTHGRPHSGGTMRRWKFRKEAQVIVRRRTGDVKASFDMFALDGKGEPVSLGSVSAHTHFKTLAPGEALVARVSYLYASKSLKLVQPSVEGLLPDTDPKGCATAQLVIGKVFDE